MNYLQAQEKYADAISEMCKKWKIYSESEQIVMVLFDTFGHDIDSNSDYEMCMAERLVVALVMNDWGVYEFDEGQKLYPVKDENGSHYIMQLNSGDGVRVGSLEDVVIAHDGDQDYDCPAWA